MIVGIGNDIVDIRRIEKTLARFPTRFVHRIFTAAERARCEGRHARGAAYAKRFAAKEACAKALGTGFRRGVAWRDLETVNRPTGKPMMIVSGAARCRLDALVPPGHEAHIEVSLSDEYPYAIALVVISTRARDAADHP